jgi:HD-GYP domain-containing protein (c-di-GMP phosphodiesterase class II)
MESIGVVTAETPLPLPAEPVPEIAPRPLDRGWLARRAIRLDSGRSISASVQVANLVRAAGAPRGTRHGHAWQAIGRRGGAAPVDAATASRDAHAAATDSTRAGTDALSLPASPVRVLAPRSAAARAIVAPDRGVRTAELLAALSTALDIAEGHEPGHAIRTCFVALRVADVLQLPDADRQDLFYAALLKDAGSSWTAAAMAQVLGTSDIEQKRDLAQRDPHAALAMTRFTLRHLGRLSTLDTARRLPGLLVSGAARRREFVEERAERGAELAHRLGLAMPVSEAIHAMRERWDGRGEPLGIRGPEIPLAARILAVAEAAALYAHRRGARAAERTLRRRRKRWYDPDLVDLLLGMVKLGLWRELAAPDLIARTVALEPGRTARLSDAADIDRIALAFAEVVDAKSPFTHGHSVRVGDLSGLVATRMALPAAAVTDIRRAGLLHDLGKLGVPNTVLDKRGPLTPDERAAVVRHPQRSFEVLSRVPIFSGVAEIALCHHERLDGSGYPHGLRGAQLTPGVRIVAVADAFEALTATRSYREAVSVEEALEVLEAAAGRLLAAEAVAALRAVV